MRSSLVQLHIEFHDGGLRLAELGLWLDAHEPQTGPERVFVSHAHSDHVAPHREVILSAPTARLMAARLGGARLEHVLNFGEPRRFEYGPAAFQLTLVPAGHIFGSAMSLLEFERQSLLYTGDFKLRRSLSAEPCEPRQADILVMESTFGRPQYVFPPTQAVLEGVVHFCREALDNDETPVLFGYSLGKSQELLCGLAEAGLPLMLHGAAHQLTRIYEQFGQRFPSYEQYSADGARGKVLLCPPNSLGPSMLRALGKTRTAILTGWAVDPNCRFRYRCDAAFPLSDHADFPALIEMVKQVQPKKVYTLHGFAADFAQTLRHLGYDARSLSQDEQLALPFALAAPSIRTRSPIQPPMHTEGPDPSAQGQSAASGGITPDSFLEFARTCSRIGADRRKLEKVRLLSEYLRALRGQALGWAVPWFSGRPFAAAQNKVLQLGWAILRDALGAVSGVDASEFHQVYLKHSDLGRTAFELLHGRQAVPGLSLGQVNETFEKLAAARGPLAKTPLLVSLLERCTELEAEYVVKIITGDLRIGLKEGLVEEAVASAFSQPAEAVRQAHLLVGDLGEAAKLASDNRLNQAALLPFRPARFMLASPEESAGSVWKRLKHSEAGPTRAWLEDKYDGIRCQLHKEGTRVAIFSRDLKDITSTFLELSDAARELKAEVILDGEIVAQRGDRVLPFAELQKRLGRRQDDLFMRETVPIQYAAFDLLWLNGQSLLDRPLRERRQALERLGPLPTGFCLAHTSQAACAADIQAAFEAALARGNEGLMIKDPGSVYAPGRRGLAWLKLKKAFATLDCVVVGAEYGHGKRGQVLSDYTFAVRDERSGQLATIGKAYTGLTDVEIAQLTEHFLKRALRQHGRYFEVPPDTVLEIAFDKIQPSNRHSSGLALRFPRIVRIRTDKSPAEIDTLDRARQLAQICGAAQSHTTDEK
ncbi:putative DNA ligase [Verrucomicrobia bacterium]|nr:putative DNA ligase [Verrucomicrobiota bacterium]